MPHLIETHDYDDIHFENDINVDADINVNVDFDVIEVDVDIDVDFCDVTMLTSALASRSWEPGQRIDASARRRVHASTR